MPIQMWQGQVQSPLHMRHGARAPPGCDGAGRTRHKPGPPGPRCKCPRSSTPEDEQLQMSYHTRAACTYFRAGRCTKGELCPFSHAVEDKPQTCKWYKKMVGCRYGVSRRMPPPNTATAGCVGVVGSVAAAHALALFSSWMRSRTGIHARRISAAIPTTVPGT